MMYATFSESMCSACALAERLCDGSSYTRIDQHAVERGDSAASTAESAGGAVLKATLPCRAKATSLPDCLCAASRRHVLMAHEYFYLRY
jgi:hypothetical protein